MIVVLVVLFVGPVVRFALVAHPSKIRIFLYLAVFPSAKHRHSSFWSKSITTGGPPCHHDHLLPASCDMTAHGAALAERLVGGYMAVYKSLCRLSAS